MKIILSRKGFDSANGGIVSPIFEDGTMVSFPIPSDDNNKFNELAINGITYDKILSSLNYKGKCNCHIDPDLDNKRRIKPIENWVPIFGQVDSAASYLMNTVQIQPGDIFLFFGNYHFVEKVNGEYKYCKKKKDFYKDNDLQVIWGYMQIDKIVDAAEEQKKYTWHPHSKKFTDKKSNRMFIGREKLSFDETMPGYGVFKFSKKRVLTKEGFSKANWVHRDFYSNDSIFTGEKGRKNSSKKPDETIYYAGIWQELGLKESEDCTNRVKKILKD